MSFSLSPTTAAPPLRLRDTARRRAEIWRLVMHGRFSGGAGRDFLIKVHRRDLANAIVAGLATASKGNNMRRLLAAARTAPVHTSHAGPAQLTSHSTPRASQLPPAARRLPALTKHFACHLPVAAPLQTPRPLLFTSSSPLFCHCFSQLPKCISSTSRRFFFSIPISLTPT